LDGSPTPNQARPGFYNYTGTYDVTVELVISPLKDQAKHYP